MKPDELGQEGIDPIPTQTVDLGQYIPVDHQFDRIIGNELRCSLHDTCAVIMIKPTEVLEKGDDDELHLVDKAPRTQL